MPQVTPATTFREERMVQQNNRHARRRAAKLNKKGDQ